MARRPAWAAASPLAPAAAFTAAWLTASRKATGSPTDGLMPAS